MLTNTPRQQATRRMTAAQKDAMIAERIAQDHEANEAHAARYRATVAMWQHAAAAGLTPAEKHALDMALMRGGDPDYLSTTF
jgi:hypothetical protein